MNNVKFLWTKSEMMLTLGVPQDLWENTGGHIPKLFCKGQAVQPKCHAENRQLPQWNELPA
jgi:hypothetical protein